MLRQILCLAVCVALPHLTIGMYSCTVPVMNGNWILGADGKQCVSVVKGQCSGLAISTCNWKKGIHVKTNCNTIPRNTAIATFSGNGGCYGNSSSCPACKAPFQHAAIFESCQSDGINVIDQWDTRAVNRRTIRYAGTKSDGGDNFFTIEK